MPRRDINQDNREFLESKPGMFQTVTSHHSWGTGKQSGDPQAESKVFKLIKFLQVCLCRRQECTRLLLSWQKAIGESDVTLFSFSLDLAIDQCQLFDLTLIAAQ